MVLLSTSFRNQALLRVGAEFLKRTVTFSLLLLATGLSPCYGQESDAGRRIYAENAQSVLLLYAQSADGQFVAQGTGFVIEGQRIVTNAHVANAGKIFVELGPARVATHVEKIFGFDDLAILQVAEIQLTVKALRLSNGDTATGMVVYAIGNPEGLEKTISQGVVSGQREVDGRKLLQITATLSHGSSGGPIFNSSGEVIGVAVGSMTSGQNLNFAIPVSLLEKTLSGANRTDSSSTLGTLGQIHELDQVQREEAYSEDADSPWQSTERQIATLLEKAFGEAGTNSDALVSVSEAAVREGELDIAVQAAQRAVESRPSVETQLSLAKALNSKGLWSQTDDRKELYNKAERAARAAVAAAHPPSGETYFVLGNILENEGSYIQADTELRRALALEQKIADKDAQSESLRDLILCASNLNKEAEAQQWFDALVSLGGATPFDWSSQAGRLEGISKFKDAGDAYRVGANSGGPYAYWCKAATDYVLAPDFDLGLSSARTCIELGIGKDGSEINLAKAHREIADILNERGVYSEALSHSKEATVLTPKDAFAFDSMAVALTGLHRPQEAIVAGQ
jgi:tetratricopeptide (TPR) repeat protein